ncbi:MAG: 6-phosphofructokinase [Lachnospiraceae bacterium]|nr:6-phosphofructokinase [Lachnospiraceae bacterium]
MKKNLIVGQSGGPTAVINSSLYGVVTEALAHEEIGKVLGMRNGIKGFLDGNVIDLGTLSSEELSLLQTTPAMYLGSCRYKLPVDLGDPIYPRIFEALDEMNVGYFLYNGGNDSMDTVDRLSSYAARIGSDIRFVGIPKTIDDDLVETDHTPGYGSAAKFVASQVRQMTLDTEVYRQDSVLIIEIMGRNAGWLTAASVLARKYPGDNPMLVYLPETTFDVPEMLERVEIALHDRHAVVICISEGIHDKDGHLICESPEGGASDVFGNKLMSGAGKALENIIKAKLGVKVRSVELNVTQRSAAGDLSLADVTEAAECGKAAVRAALEGRTACMITMERTSNDPYTIEYVPRQIGDISNATKFFPAEWIIKDGTDISSDFLDYALPLIRGEIYPPMKDGLPQFLYINHTGEKR